MLSFKILKNILFDNSNVCINHKYIAQGFNQYPMEHHCYRKTNMMNLLETDIIKTVEK